MGKRETADQRIVNYVGVSSIDEYLSKVEKLRGKVLMQKTAVPGWRILQSAWIQKITLLGSGRMTRRLNDLKHYFDVNIPSEIIEKIKNP